MATVRWYLTNGVDANGWQALSLTAQSAATCNAGWVVGTGATNNAELQANTERASTTFTGTTVPDGTLDTSLKDAFRIPLLVGGGTFASANWTFQFTVIGVTQSGAADGQIVFRLVKANADGSSATEITSGQQTASLLTDIATTGVNSTLTFNPGAVTLTGSQYLFIQVAWKRTGAGGMTTTNVRLRTGSSTTVGTSILSSDFTPGNQAVTGVTIASASVASSSTGGDVIVDATPGIEGSSDEQGPTIGQSFIGHVGNLTGISLFLSRANTDSDTIKLELRQYAYDGPLLAQSSPVAVSTLTTGGAWQLFTLAYTLVADVVYVFRLVRQGGVSTAFVNPWYAGTRYLNGTAYDTVGGITVPSSNDLKFKLHGVGGWSVWRVLPPPTLLTVTPISPGVVADLYDQTLVNGGFPNDGTFNALSDDLDVYAQSFHASARFSAVQVMLFTSTAGGGSDATLILEIRAGGPTGTVVATAGSIPASETHGPTGLYLAFKLLRFDFATVDPGGSSTLYTWTLRRVGATTGNETFVMYAIDVPGVPDSSWTTFTGGAPWEEWPDDTFISRVLGESVFAPTVALMGGGADQGVTTQPIASTAAMTAPTVALDQAVAGAFIGGGTPSALLTDLVGYWKLDEASGNALDAHSTNDLTAGGAPGTTTGKVAGARTFSPAASQFFTHADNPALSTGPSTSFTVQAWVKFNDVSATQIIVGRWGGAGNYEWILFYDATFSGGMIRWIVCDDGSSTFRGANLNALGLPSTGVWYLIHGWYDISAGLMGVAVNGAVAGGGDGALIATITDTASSFTVGRNDDSGGSSYFDGVIDEVGYWKRALTDAERASLYNSGAGLAYNFGGGGGGGGVSLFAPTVISDQAVAATTIAVGSSLFEPTVVPTTSDQAVTTTPIASGSGLFTPTVALEGQTIVGATIAGLYAGLEAYWTCDESSGNLLDSHGANTLTSVNAVGSATGIISTGRTFNGTTQYATIADNPALSTGDVDFTIQVWVKFSALPAALLSLVARWSETTNFEYLLAFLGGLDGGLTGTSMFLVSPDGLDTSTTTVTNETPVTVGAWALVHAWHDSVNNQIGLSINAGTPTIEATSAGVFNSAAPTVVGGGVTWDGDSLFANAAIDEIAFWKRVLTAGERLAAYNSGAGLAYPSLGSAGGRLFAPSIAQNIVTVPIGTAVSDDVLLEDGSSFVLLEGVTPYAYSTTATVQSSMITGTVTGHVATLHLSGTRYKSAANGGHIQHVDGWKPADFAVYDSTGTLLDFEVASWDQTTGEMWVHALMPSAADGSTLSIRYGGPSTVYHGNDAAVWVDPILKDVWHFTNQGGSLNLTSSKHGVTVSNTGVTLGTDRGGTAVFNGGTDALNAGTPFVLDDSFVIMAVVKPSALTRGDLVTVWDDADPAVSQFKFNIGEGLSAALRLFGSTGSVVASSPSASGFSAPAITTSDWSVLHGLQANTYLGTLVRGYVYNQTETGDAPNTSGLVDLIFGNNAGGTGAFSGEISEIRIYDDWYTASKLYAEADNLSFPDTFWGYSAESTLATSYAYAVVATVQASQISGTLTNFPTLLHLTNAVFKSVANGGHITNVTATWKPADFAVYASDGTTLLPFEVSAWNQTTGDLWVHVLLSSATDGTQVVVRYGNAAVTAYQGDDAAVWADTDIDGVFHFTNQNGALALTDAKGHHTLTNYGATLGTDRGGTAVFNGSSRIDGGAGTGPTGDRQFVIVFKPGVIGSAGLHELLARWTNTLSTSQFHVFISGSTGLPGIAGVPMFHVTSGVQQELTDYTGGLLSAGTWYCVHASFGSSTLTTLLNGAAYDTEASSFASIGTSTAANLRFGDNQTGSASAAGNHPYTGEMSEVRFYDSVRSAAWVAAESRNLLTPDTFWGVTSEIAPGHVLLEAVFVGASQTFAPSVAGSGSDQAVTGVHIASTAALTPPSVATGPVTVIATTLASTAQLFVPSVTTGPVTITGATIAATSLVRVPSVAPGPVTVTGATRASTLVVTAPAVALVATGATIPSASGTFPPSVAQTVVTLVRPSTAVLNVPTVGLPIALVTTALIGSTLQVFAPTVAAGPVAVTTGTILTTAQLFVPTVTVGATAVTGGTVASTVTLSPATVTPGAVTITVGTVTGAPLLFAPSVTVGAVTITTPALGPDSQLFLPIVSPAGVTNIGATTLGPDAVLFPPTVATTLTLVTGATIGSLAQTFAPTLAGAVVTAFRASTSVLFAPTVTTLTAITTATLGSTAVLFPPTILTVGSIGGPTTGSTIQLFAPSVTTGAVTVVGGTVAALSQVFAPTVTAGATSVTGVTLASTAVLFPPTFIARLDGTFIASTATLFPPQVKLTLFVTGAHLPTGVLLFEPSTLPVTVVTGATILNTAQLFAPSVAVGPVTVVGGTVTTTAQLFAPSLGVGAVTVTSAHRASTLTLFAPSVVGVTTGATIASTSQLFPLTVTTGPVSVTGTTLGSTVVLTPPAVGFGVTLPRITNLSLSFAPTLAPVVSTPLWVVTTTLFPPSALPLGEMILAFLPSGLIVFPPAMVGYAPPPEIIDVVSSIVRGVAGTVVLCREAEGTVILTRHAVVTAALERVYEPSVVFIRQGFVVEVER